MKEKKAINIQMSKVLTLLDQYLQEKMNNNLISAWASIKKNSINHDNQTSVQTFSRPTNRSLKNIIPITSRHGALLSKSNKFSSSKKEHKSQIRYLEQSQGAYTEKLQSIHSGQIGDDFEDLVLSKLQTLEKTISKLKNYRKRSDNFESRAKATSIIERKSEKNQILKYIPMGRNRKARNMQDLIHEKDSYSIKQNDKNIPNVESPNFKVPGLVGLKDNIETPKFTEDVLKEMKSSGFEPTLEELYESHEISSHNGETGKTTKNNERDKPCCQCSSFWEYPVVMAVNKPPGSGLYRLVPYQIGRSTDRPNREMSRSFKLNN